MLDRAKAGRFAYPAINVTSSQTLNAALQGFAEAGSDGIVQVSTGGAEYLAGQKVKDMVGDYVDQLNARLNRWETVKKWILLDHDLSVESGELTPSMKVKRKVVEENHKDEIDALYR